MNSSLFAPKSSQLTWYPCNLNIITPDILLLTECKGIKEFVVGLEIKFHDVRHRRLKQVWLSYACFFTHLHTLVDIEKVKFVKDLRNNEDVIRCGYHDPSLYGIVMGYKDSEGEIDTNELMNRSS